ncbi:MAG TPA: carboxypeptidase regulatory-like domain-containing protein [Longimicrobium sp.]|nr:carboxypeptidase regulatory-like domain-containing protein [Longimicrobium sp.]
MRIPALLVLAMLALAAPAAVLQAQTTDATVVVTVRSTDDEALADASVELRNASTGFTVRSRTGSDGRATFRQLPLGGPYTVSASRIGFAPRRQTGYTLALGSRVEATLRLADQALALEAVVVSGDGEYARDLRLGGSTRIGASELRSLPTTGRNFTDLAGLAPTVGPTLSINGQRPTATDIRLDGLQSRNMLRGGELGRGPYTVSMEAIREFEVVTNVYDVTLGRQGGGTISAATREGTNTWTGTFFAYGRDDRLSAAEDFVGRGRDVRDFGVLQWGGSVGGPLVRDRLHLFAALDRQDSREPLFVADLRSPRDEVDAGIAADSLARALTILQDLYGTDARQVGVFGRRPQATTLFARLDWQASARHRVTLRHNLSDWDNPNNDVGDQALSLFESRSSIRSTDHQSLLAVRSELGASSQNEFKLGVSFSGRELTPNSLAPRGFVRVRSALPDGSTGDVRLQFGGNRLAPERSGERQIQLINTTWITRGRSTLVLGTDNSLTQLRTHIPIEQGGLFEFETLADLEALRPFRYSRQVPLNDGEQWARQSVLDAGVFAQAEWRPSGRLTATLGARYDVTAFLTAAPRNPVVEDSLGLRTDRTPTDRDNLQPRAQATWDVGGDGRDVVRAGAGAFAAQPHYYLQANSLFNSGTDLADLVLSGTAVPRPDYAAYRRDRSAVPGIPAGAAVPAYVNLTSPAFETPTTWKANLSYQRRLGERVTVAATALVARTVDNYHYVDRNLVADPAFGLDAEDGRPVFVPAASIDSRGRTSFRNARRTAALTHALELVPAGELRQRALVLEASLSLAREGSLHASYTWNRTRDNSSFNCCIARTASLLTPVRGDPRDLDGAWGPSDTDFRRKLVVFGTLPALAGFRVSGRYVGSTGRPFSLVVNGDINGDDYNGNDLAFLFDPDDPATAPDVAASMRRVMENPDNVAGAYIRNNLGSIAGRNAVFAPWVWRLDARVSRPVRTFGRQRAELVMDVYNLANLINSEWGGQYLLPGGISASNAVQQRLNLLNVVGFDPATRRYRYSVNENVGVLRKQGDPYQIQLGLRYVF